MRWQLLDQSRDIIISGKFWAQSNLDANSWQFNTQVYIIKSIRGNHICLRPIHKIRKRYYSAGSWSQNSVYTMAAAKYCPMAIIWEWAGSSQYGEKLFDLVGPGLISHRVIFMKINIPPLMPAVPWEVNEDLNLLAI